MARPDGAIVMTKDVLAISDKQAVDIARNEEDCPVCDVWRAGKKIGSVT
jgi:hypothetical protein